MLRVFKFIVWTTLAIAFGVYLGAYEIDGRSVYEHASKLWRQQGSGRLTQVKGDIEGAISDAKRAGVLKAAPTEHHSEADKDAVNALVARRGAK